MAAARLHDLYHSHASHAVVNGEILHVAGLLFGDRRVFMTNRYVHLDEATLSQDAERVAQAVERPLRRCFRRKRKVFAGPMNSLRVSALFGH